MKPVRDTIIEPGLPVLFTVMYLWIHVTPRQTNDELVLSLPIDVTDNDQIEDWFQLRASIAESELRPKQRKMALKYAFKLIFVKWILQFIINTAPPTSNSVHGREKCFKF